MQTKKMYKIFRAEENEAIVYNNKLYTLDEVKAFHKDCLEAQSHIPSWALEDPEMNIELISDDFDEFLADSIKDQMIVEVTVKIGYMVKITYLDSLHEGTSYLYAKGGHVRSFNEIHIIDECYESLTTCKRAITRYQKDLDSDNDCFARTNHPEYIAHKKFEPYEIIFTISKENAFAKEVR